MPQAMQHLMASRSDGASPRAALLKERFARHLGMINNRLSHHAYIAGETFTAADILLQFPFGTMSAFAPIDISAHPHIRAWLDRLSARPAYQKAMKAAGHTTDPAQPEKTL